MFSLADLNHSFNYSTLCEDTLYISFKVGFTDRWNCFRDKILSYQEKMKRQYSGGGELPAEFEEDEGLPEFGNQSLLSTCGHSFAVAPHGFRFGNSFRSYYPIVLQECGIRYLFSSRNADSRYYNAVALIGSETLQRWGAVVAFELVRDSFRALGVEYISDIVSRVDIAKDFDGFGVDRLQDYIYNGWYSCRARSKSLNGSTTLDDRFYFSGRKKTGFSLGSSNILFRCYDKLEEMIKNHSSEKLAIFAKKYGGKIPDKITRFEFQIRRDALKSFKFSGENINSFADYIKYRADLLKYLCTSWLRIFDKDINHNHSERFGGGATCPEWQEYINCCADFGECVSIVSRETIVKAPDKKALVRQSVGSLLSVFAADVSYKGENINNVCKRYFSSPFELARKFSDYLRGVLLSEFDNIREKFYGRYFDYRALHSFSVGC